MTNKEMTNDEARAYFIDSNERIISVVKDENRYNYEAQQIEDVFMRRNFEANSLAIQALEQTDLLDKIRAEIEEYKSRQLTLAIGVEDLEKGKQIALEYVLAILDKYKAESDDKGEISDGYHTFNKLYHQRAILFATIVNQNKDKAWKSFKHSDGKYCFDSDGEWFIVGVDTPQGSYTYHYSKEYWDIFNCQELECGKEWDGHTEEDVTRLLSLEQDGSNCYECVKGMSDNFEAQPTDAVKYDCTTEEIAKSFTEDVEAVKDQLDGQSTDITVEMYPKEAIEILEHERDNDIFVTTEHRARIHQALTMGIKALKAQIKADECFNNIDSPMIRVNLEICKDCYYNDGEVHGQCIICDKYRVILQADKRIEDGGE